jgi:hypothetical protein
MNDEKFTSVDIFTFSVFTLLVTQIIYHLFIYFGRHGKERLYYLNFSLFALSFFIDFVVGSDIQRFIFPSEKIRRLISPGVTGTCYFLIHHFALRMFKLIFKLPDAKNKLFLPFYISFSIYGVLLASYLVLDYDSYLEQVFPLLAIFGTIPPVYTVVFFINHLLKAKKVKNYNTRIIILAGYSIFMFDFFLEEVLELFDIYYFLKNTYVVSGLSIFFWALALAVRFNNEHKELQVLKVSLEEKIQERTLQLVAANEERINTFIQLAHETRTPLTIIKKQHTCLCYKIWQN